MFAYDAGMSLWLVTIPDDAPEHWGEPVASIVRARSAERAVDLVRQDSDTRASLQAHPVNIDGDEAVLLQHIPT